MLHVYHHFFLYSIVVICYLNISPSIVCCLFSCHTYISFGITSFVSEVVLVFEVFATLLAILLLIKSPFASAVV